MRGKETTFSHPAQDAAETFAASLEAIGLVLSDGWNGEGRSSKATGSDARDGIGRGKRGDPSPSSAAISR